MDCRRYEVELAALAYDELDPETAASVRAHLAACPSCRDTWDRMTRTRAALDGLPGPDSVPADLAATVTRAARLAARRRGGRRFGPVWRAAAAVLLLVAGGLVGAALTGRGRPASARPSDADARQAARLLTAVQLMRYEREGASADDPFDALEARLLEAAPARIGRAMAAIRRAGRERRLGNFERSRSLLAEAAQQAAGTDLERLASLETARALIDGLGRPEDALALLDGLRDHSALADAAAFETTRALIRTGRCRAALTELDALTQRAPGGRLGRRAAELAARTCYDRLDDYDGALRRYSQLARAVERGDVCGDRGRAVRRRLTVLRASAPDGFASIDLMQRLAGSDGAVAVALAAEFIESYPHHPLADEAADRLCAAVVGDAAMPPAEATRWRRLDAAEAERVWRLGRAAAAVQGDAAWYLRLRQATCLAGHPATRNEAAALLERIESGPAPADVRRAAAAERGRLTALASL